MVVWQKSNAIRLNEANNLWVLTQGTVVVEKIHFYRAQPPV